MSRNFHIFKRFFATSPTGGIKPKICIVGSGPAGFYAAQYMAKRLEIAEIDIYERLPVPFGLVRFGVAPDHSNLKKCTNTFTKTAQLKNIRYFGNVTLGKDVSFKQLKEAYHIVLLTYGVDDSKKLEVNGSNLGNIFQAKNFVGWYNGVPWDKDLPIDLSGSSATIFGHGNVAIDVARILLSPIDKLKPTDITEHALANLSQSKIKEVHLVGRRGPLQVSFTTKELRELLNLTGCCNIWRDDDLQGVAEIIPELVKPRKRLTELLVEKFENRKSPNIDEKLLKMVFLRSPKEFLGKTTVNSIKLTINQLEGVDLLNKKAVATENEEIIQSNLVVSSVGYKSIQADQDIPFDHNFGKVQCSRGKIMQGVYAAGWLANGATGVLLHTMENAFGVASIILKDIEAAGLVQINKPGYEHIKQILTQQNIQIVTWQDWLKIDEFERKQGEKLNKPREKIVQIEEMLKIAAS